jgi:hypothetical protein
MLNFCVHCLYANRLFYQYLFGHCSLPKVYWICSTLGFDSTPVFRCLVFIITECAERRLIGH